MIILVIKYHIIRRTSILIYHLYNENNDTDLVIGSTYNKKIYGEINHVMVDKVRITSLGVDKSVDPGSNNSVSFVRA